MSARRTSQGTRLLFLLYQEDKLPGTFPEKDHLPNARGTRHLEVLVECEFEKPVLLFSGTDIWQRVSRESDELRTRDNNCELREGRNWL